MAEIGFLGLGNMGTSHLDYVPNIPGVTVTAVCDTDPAKLEMARRMGADGGGPRRAAADGGGPAQRGTGPTGPARKKS